MQTHTEGTRGCFVHVVAWLIKTACIWCVGRVLVKKSKKSSLLLQASSSERAVIPCELMRSMRACVDTYANTRSIPVHSVYQRVYVVNTYSCMCLRTSVILLPKKNNCIHTNLWAKLRTYPVSPQRVLCKHFIYITSVHCIARNLGRELN